MTRIPIACTLTTGDAEAQVEEWRRLFARAGAVEVGAGHARVRLPLDDDIVLATAALARRERACCGFFEFLLEPVGDDLWLHVRVPAEAQEVLERFAALATPAAPS